MTAKAQGALDRLADAADRRARCQAAPRWEVIHGDCLGVMADAALMRRVGLVVTDPPYGISLPTDYADRGRGLLAPCRNYAPVAGDDVPFDPAPILRLGVPTVMWGANWFADRLPSSGGWLAWDKQRPAGIDQADAELAWTNYVKGVRVFRHLWHGMMRASEHGESYHPTQKPVALMQWTLSLRWTPRPPALIFDPFCGSGPVGVAAVQMGYDYIGVDLSADYVETARRRITAAAAQTSLGLEAA